MSIETAERPEVTAATAAARKSPSRRPRAVLTRVAAAIFALLLVLVIAVAFLPSAFWRWLIVHEISSATGRPAAIDGDVKVHLFSFTPELSIEGLTVDNAPWAGSKKMLSVKRFDATLSLKSLLRLHLIFPQVTIDGPALDVQRDSSGRSNWEFSSAGNAKQKPQPSAPLHLPVVQELKLTNGTLTAVDRVRKLTFNGQVSVQESQNTADNHALKLRGSGTLNAKPFRLVLDGEPLIGVDPSKPYGFETSVTAADIKLNARASIAHPFDLAKLQADFHVSGSDLADVYYLTGLALPNTPPYDVAGTLVRDNLRFTIDDFRGKLGSSDIAGKIAVDTGRERPKLEATLVSKQLNLADLAAPLGTEATPARKSDTLARPAPAPAPTPPTLLLPDADLQVQRVRAMDADVHFDAAAITAAKMPMKKVHFHLNLNDGKITLDPLGFVLPQGEFAGTVSIDARGAIPQTSIDMKLSNVDLEQFKPKSGKDGPLDGELLGRIQLHGTGSSVHKAAATASGDLTFVMPKGEMRESLAELTGIDLSRGLGLILTKNERNTEVRCGVANFKAADGDLKASTLLIDTTNVVVTGQGDINLQSEVLDLSLQGKPKKARVLRLRTPILVRGTLLQPKIGVEPGKVAAQTGGAVALGALLTPVAALLAFVDGGLAKDANCAALIGEAEQGKNLPRE
ncbi:MAG TPA: AsmA family protein [Steroidobacteraceae bacterium]|nr:AsmA family protein [Steroidobacteraceae bacterium]